MLNRIKPKYFVLDVDGVMTTGQFIYSKHGKVYKVFGPHDSDGLKLIREKINIVFITADKRGFEITEKRIADDMGYELKLVSEMDRYIFLQENYGLGNLIYMGDGIFDVPLLADCLLGITPNNARIEARQAADYITPSNSGEGAVLDACLHVLRTLFGSFDLYKLIRAGRTSELIS